MSLVIKAKKGGHSFSFVYDAPTADTVWVERAEDVPPWDWTRWNKAGGGLRLEGAFLKTRWTDEGLAYAWGRALPTPPMSYPRLVRRQHEQHFSRVSSPVYVEFLRLWRVAKKYEVMPRAADSQNRRKFQEAVAKAALRIGILSPHGTADSLPDWWEAALEVTFWVRLLNDLNMVEGPILPEDFWLFWEADWDVEIFTRNDPEELAELDTSGKEMLEALNEIPGVRWRKPQVHDDGGRSVKASGLIHIAQSASATGADGNGAVTPAGARAAIAQQCLFSPFLREALQHSTAQLEDGLGLPTALRARVGALDWARYELAQLYGATQTRACASPSCAAVFVPRRKNERFCSPTCKEREKKARQRAASSRAGNATTVPQPPKE